MQVFSAREPVPSIARPSDARTRMTVGPMDVPLDSASAVPPLSATADLRQAKVRMEAPA